MVANFLWSSGTGGPPNTGLTVTAVTLMSTDLVQSAGAATGIVSSGTAVSLITLGNSVAGMFASSNFAQAMWGDLFLVFGTSTGSMPAGANLAGWWMTSPDGGTTFETTRGSSSTPMPRPPDWVITIDSSTQDAGEVHIARNVPLPALPFKVFVQNNMGVTVFSSTVGGTNAYSKLILASYAMQY